MQATKYVVSVLRTFMINSWIGSTSGNIQMSIKDIDNDKWLTVDEIITLTNPNEDGEPQNDFSIKVIVGDVLKNAESYTVKRFTAEHPSGTNQILEDSDAGFIKAHFEGLTQNEIANIKFDNIKIELQETEEYRYIFTTDENSFANAVSYVENI